MKYRRITQWLITISAILLLGAHLIWPKIAIDSISLGLLAVAVLPWVASLFKSVELPGGLKVEFQSLQDAGKEIQNATGSIKSVPRPSYLEVSELDPSLALVGLRIEIEKRLRAVAESHELDDKQQPLSRLLHSLQRQGILGSQLVSGLRELIQAGNHAAHGAEVDERIGPWAFDVGPSILGVLDRLLEHSAPKHPE